MMVQNIVNDELKAGQTIYQMEELKREKRDAQLKGKDYMMKNVEKAGVWMDV